MNSFDTHNVYSNNNFISSQLGNFQENLNFGHFNCQSFKLNCNSSKISEIRNILVGGYLSVIGVSETWLKPHISTRAVDVSGYSCHRNDRPNIRGGGVAIYVSKKIRHRIVFLGERYGDTECIFVELNVGAVKLLAGVVYLPHGNFNGLEDQISDLVVKYSEVIIMGDFNNNLFDINKSNLVRSVSSNMNLSIVHNCVPTHYDIAHNSNSLIDYFLVSSPKSVKLSNQFHNPGISHHAVIFVSIDVIKPNVQIGYEYYDYNSIDNVVLQTTVSECDFSEMYVTSDVDEQLNILNNNLHYIHSIVPRKKYVYNFSSSDDWCQHPDIRYHDSLRDLAYSAYLRDKTPNNWKVFCKCRNRSKNIKRKYKRLTHAALFYNKTVKEIWSILDCHGVNKDLEVDNDADAEHLNRIFLSNQSQDTNRSQTIFHDNIYEGFSFQPVSCYDMSVAFEMIKSNAVGSDTFSLKFLKTVLPFLSFHVLHLVNTVLMSSVFPAQWKVAKIIPIRKKKSSSAEDNFRPISIMPILSKMLEYIMKIQLMGHIDENDLLHDCQAGFRTHRSTTSALIGLTDNIRQSVDSHLCCSLLSLDLHKAFDKLDHAILITKLRNLFNFSTSACKLINSYLENRWQYVHSNGKCSSILPVNSGVPQGSVLGPLFFVIYMNDLFDIIASRNCVPFAYADDIQILFKGSIHFLDVLESEVSSTTWNLVNWMRENKISINADKTNVMHFGNNVVASIPIVLNGRNINAVNKLTCLGVVLDNKLTFESHVNSIISKVNFLLRKLYNMDLYIPLYVKVKLIHGIVMPIFLYCLEVYSGTCGYIMKKIYLTFNRVMRYVYNVRSHDHISHYVVSFLGCTFPQYVNIRCLLHFYKLFKLQTPAFEVSFFKFSRSTRNPQLMFPKLSPLLDKSYHVRVARVFNKLPPTMRVFNVTPETYKKYIYQCVQNNQF